MLSCRTAFASYRRNERATTSVLMQSSDVCGPVPQGLPPSVGSAVGVPSITRPVLGIPKVRILGSALLCFALPSARYRTVPVRTFTIPYFPSSLIPYISSYLRLLLISPLAFPFSYLASIPLLFMAINPTHLPSLSLVNHNLKGLVTEPENKTL